MRAPDALLSPVTFLKHQDQHNPRIPGIPGHVAVLFWQTWERYISHFISDCIMFYFLSYASHIYEQIKHPLLCPDPSAFLKNANPAYSFCCAKQIPIASWHEVIPGKYWYVISLPSCHLQIHP